MNCIEEKDSKIFITYFNYNNGLRKIITHNSKLAKKQVKLNWKCKISRYLLEGSFG